MDTILQIAPINPIRFKQPNLGEYDFEFSRHKCYFQKFNLSDKTMFQIATDFSDFENDVTITIVDYETGLNVLTLTPFEIPSNISGLKFYNVPIDFSLVTEGYYFIRIDSDIFLESEPFNVAEDHEETLLIEYLNTDNNFDTVFTGTVFSLRIEGTIQNFTPSSEDEIYINQRHNPVMLYSQPYRMFTLFVGNAAGIPDWMIDKANRAFACDTLNVNGFPFGKSEGAEWEVLRTEEYPFAGMTLEILPLEKRERKLYKARFDADTVCGAQDGQLINIWMSVFDYARIQSLTEASQISGIKAYLDKDSLEEITEGWYMFYEDSLNKGFYYDSEFTMFDICPTPIVPIEVYLDGQAVEFEFSMAVSIGIASALAENVKVVGNVVAYFEGDVYGKYPFSITIEAGNTNANISVSMNVFSDNYYVFEDLIVVPVEIGGNPLVITGKTIVIEN